MTRITLGDVACCRPALQHTTCHIIVLSGSFTCLVGGVRLLGLPDPTCGCVPEGCVAVSPGLVPPTQQAVIYRYNQPTLLATHTQPENLLPSAADQYSVELSPEPSINWTAYAAACCFAISSGTRASTRVTFVVSVWFPIPPNWCCYSPHTSQERSSYPQQAAAVLEQH